MMPITSLSTLLMPLTGGRYDPDDNLMQGAFDGVHGGKHRAD